MRINIIGAGLSGLICANMLRRHDIIVYERQASIPNNHHAVLRFRTPEVGNVLGIPFKKVDMIKTHVNYRNLVADSLSYSKKVTGEYLSDRSIIAGTTYQERYIAPPDLIEQMTDNIDIDFGIDYNFVDSKLPTISTIPMPALMNLLDYPVLIGFKSIPGMVYSATIEDCDAYVSVLFPGHEPYSRATITGNHLMIEFPEMVEAPETVDLAAAFCDLGIHDATIFDGEFKKQDYFKITSINDAERKKFQRWATVKYNVYSLGRYATWRPKYLLDDLVRDVRKIEGWIVGGNK